MGRTVKRNILIWIIFNIIILCAAVVGVYGKPQEDISIRNVSVTGGERYQQEFGRIKRGIYTVTVKFQANDNFKISCGGTGSHYPILYAEEHWLKASKGEQEFRFWANGEMDSFYIVINQDENALSTEGIYLKVENLKIVRNYRATIIYSMLKQLGVLIIVNILLLMWLKRIKLKGHYYVLVGLTLIFLVSSLGVFTTTLTLGHDLYFHLARIRGLATAILAGEFPVKMQPEWFNGYGHCVSVFYGDTLLYVPALLYIFNVSLAFCYKTYILLINAGTILISYFCFKRMSKDKYIGVVCTAVYVLSVYRILNIYLRAAAGEYSAMMFLPLVALAMREILVSGVEEERYKRNWFFLCIGMTGIIRTYVISVEMVGIFLIIVCIFNLKKVFRRETFLVLVKSVVITLLLNMGFFVPFLDYSREGLQIFSEKDFYGIQEYGLSLYEMFTVNTTGTGRAAMSLTGLCNRIPVSLEVGILLSLLLIVLVCIKENKSFLQLGVLTGLTLWFSTSYFPWNALADSELLKSVVFSIEFPWRFLSIAIVLISMLLGLALLTLKRKIDGRSMIMLISGLCIIMAYQALQYTDLAERNMEICKVYDGEGMMDSGMTLEYVYPETDIEALMVDGGVNCENAEVTECERIGNGIKVSCETGRNSILEFPLFAYPYYQCVDSETGEEFPIEISSVNHRVRIQMPDNYKGSVQVSFV
jgi:hypothetical protein